MHSPPGHNLRPIVLAVLVALHDMQQLAERLKLSERMR